MKNTINLDDLSEKELLDLNREIIRRLELHRNMRRQSQLMAFRIGDKVVFETELGPIKGMIVRLNQKTATVETDDGRSWRVSPGLLSKVVGQTNESEPKQRNLFSITQGN
jgi:hypothetical protein